MSKSHHKILDIKLGDKLYLITRRDLSPGYQAAQSCHALHEFARCYPNHFHEWESRSQYLAVLSVANEIELMRLLVKASDEKLMATAWYEPDQNGHITAIAIESDRKTAILCRKLPLALSEYTAI